MLAEHRDAKSDATAHLCADTKQASPRGTKHWLGILLLQNTACCVQKLLAVRSAAKELSTRSANEAT
jgi:hypothetical protein